MTQRFIHLLYAALAPNAIHPLYYGLGYWSHTQNYLQHAGEFERMILQPYLERYHERVFCYELYYRLRTLMENEINDDQENVFVANNIFLQSEVIKQNIDIAVEVFRGIGKLSREFMPDFLLHTPGNFDNQLIVMEVKSNPDLSFHSLCADLLKIQEFIIKYSYGQGIFLAVNLSEQRQDRLLRRLVAWLPDHINTQDRILLLFKNEPNNPIVEYRLSTLSAKH